MSSDKMLELANEYSSMYKSHLAMGEKEEAHSCALIVRALRFYVLIKGMLKEEDNE